MSPDPADSRVSVCLGWTATRSHEDKMAYHCPACHRAILSRRNKLCGFCREPLPAELLFTPAEVEEIETAERERALARKRREEERSEAAEREARYRDYSGG